MQTVHVRHEIEFREEKLKLKKGMRILHQIFLNDLYNSFFWRFYILVREYVKVGSYPFS